MQSPGYEPPSPKKIKNIIIPYDLSIIHLYLAFVSVQFEAVIDCVTKIYVNLYELTRWNKAMKTVVFFGTFLKEGENRSCE